MAAFKINLSIDQGATFHKGITWKVGDPTPLPVDLTGCTARMQVRESIDSENIFIELTTENGRITLGTTDGSVSLDINATDTAALDWKRGVYDLEIIFANGVVRRLLSGTVVVSPEVTR